MPKMAQFDKHKRVFCNSEVIAKELLAKNLATPGFTCCLCCVVGHAIINQIVLLYHGYCEMGLSCKNVSMLSQTLWYTTALQCGVDFLREWNKKQRFFFLSFMKLQGSLPKRVQTVLTNKDNHTKYWLVRIVPTIFVFVTCIEYRVIKHEIIRCDWAKLLN